MKKQKKQKQKPVSKNNGLAAVIVGAAIISIIMAFVAFKDGYKSGVTDEEEIMAKSINKDVQIDNFYSGNVHYLIVTSNTGDITAINYTLDSAKVASFNPIFEFKLK